MAAPAAAPAKANVNFNHIGISVPDAQAAVDWYTSVFGLEIVQPVMQIKADEPSGATMVASYGPSFSATKLAVLAFGNGTCLEIFEFVAPAYDGPRERVDFSTRTYTAGGLFHFCLTVPNVDAVVDLAVQRGGKQVGQRADMVGSERVAYVQDPWGNVVEVMSVGMELLFVKIMGAMMAANK